MQPINSIHGEDESMTEKQQQEIIDLLWDYMRRDKGSKDRVHTGWGTKTKQGLIASISRIVTGNE
jgi:hypothetical protein